ncbi:hypothetical protein HBI79_231820 [Parastagonospora nodorum]|nr:hypothetical protein HBI79_231820 [Parastagonospora nodorum]
MRRHHKTRRDLLLRQLEILVDQALILIRLVAHAACRNYANLNPLSPQRRGIAKTLRSMRPISTNNDSSRHEQQQRLSIPQQFSKTNDSTLLLTTES